MASFLRLHPTDNVVVAVNGLSPGDIVDDVKIIRRIPPGHKAAVRAIKKDEPALKFGQIIGFATEAIVPGDWVHEHNIGFHAVDRDYQFEVDARDPAPLDRRDLSGLRPGQWALRHPQLSGHSHLRELFGHRGAADRARGGEARSVG